MSADSIYRDLLSQWPYSERLLFTVTSVTAHHLSFWGFNFLLYLFYRFDLFSSYKIQGNKWPDASLVKGALKSLLPVHLILHPLLYYFGMYDVFKYWGMKIDAPLPSPWEVFWQFWFFMLINDTLFYWSHRMLHHPLLYKHIHKKHHLFRQSVGIAAEYAHPVEDFFSVFATIAPPLFFGAHFVTWIIYLFIRITETVDAHSGYNFPFSPWNRIDRIQGGADKHDFHHSHNVGNFGIFAHWDWLMGTDRAYRRWKAKQKDSTSPLVQ